MIFLSTTKYNELLAKANKNDNAELHRVHNLAIEKLKSDHETKLKNIEDEHKKKVEKMERDYLNAGEDAQRLLVRKEAEIDLVVQKATKELNEKISKLTIENESNKKEKEMLTTAFKNLGFDVKDMKDILNKLVEGVVSKNTVQVIK